MANFKNMKILLLIISVNILMVSLLSSSNCYIFGLSLACKFFAKMNCNIG